MANLLGRGYTVGQAARELGISPASVSYHRRKLGLPPRAKYAARDDWAEIQSYYNEGHSVRECQARFGFSTRSWGKAVRRGEISSRAHATPIGELLAKGRSRGRRNLKLRLLSSGLKSNRCEECGLSRWLRMPLNLALHHRNGDAADNRLENLQLLCPNCHSQTPNFSRKRRPPRPAAESGPQQSC